MFSPSILGETPLFLVQHPYTHITHITPLFSIFLPKNSNMVPSTKLHLHRCSAPGSAPAVEGRHLRTRWCPFCDTETKPVGFWKGALKSYVSHRRCWFETSFWDKVIETWNGFKMVATWNQWTYEPVETVHTSYIWDGLADRLTNPILQEMFKHSLARRFFRQRDVNPGRNFATVNQILQKMGKKRVFLLLFQRSSAFPSF